MATLVTPVSISLPAEVNNQAQVQLRIITANAPSNDEWMGIDDIQITPTASLTTSTANITEDTTGTFTIARTYTTGDLTVNLTIDGTSTAVLGSSNTTP